MRKGKWIRVEEKTGGGLKPYLSQRAVWALAVGTSIGWGSLVVMGTNYLGQGGPAGTVAGLLVGMVLMLVLSRNFHYMANIYPEAGGVYAYTKNVFGYDRAFLVSWFLSLTYISMFWANATSLPLFARYFLGDLFRFGYLYTVFGYEVYLGEVLLTAAAIVLVTLLCMRSKVAAAHLMVVMVLVFTVGIAVCFAVAMLRQGQGLARFSPAFVPGSTGALRQILRISFLSPWAFIGFESVTHSAEEYKFPHGKLFRVLVISVVTTTALYLFVTLLSISAFPPEYASWLDYVRDLGSLDGLKGLPAFYAADCYLGTAGVVLLAASLLCLVLTSLIGNLRALSRLFYAVAQDEILPKRFAELNRHEIPGRAMLLVAGLSLGIPFVGRTAIGWIVDVTTIGATLLYGFVSAAAFKTARQRGDKRETLAGGFGLLVMLVFGVYLLFPNLFSDDTLETETYILFIVWSVLGFFYLRGIVAKDHARRFGKAIIVWIALLALVVFLSMIWTGRVDERVTDEALRNIQSYYNGTADAATLALGEEAFIARQMQNIHRSGLLNTLVVVGLFVLALGAMLMNHFSMRKWEDKAIRERDHARTVAYTDPLTGVKSKAAFAEAEQETDARIEAGEAEPFAVLVCDVNGLKYVNDTFGHKAGDEYIRAASSLICEEYQHSPVFRTGGDEFVVLLTGRDYEQRETLLGDFNARVEANLAPDAVVISAGASDYRPGGDLRLHDVFVRADEAMYERKQQLKAMGAKTR